jgi:hypothetical protein
LNFSNLPVRELKVTERAGNFPVRPHKIKARLDRFSRFGLGLRLLD